MNKLKILIKIGIEMLLMIFLYRFVYEFWEGLSNFRWIYLIITILLIIYNNLENIFLIFSKNQLNNKELFNTYYINYPKVYEIAMLINNRIGIKAEDSYKHEKQQKESYVTDGSINLKKFKIGTNLGNELIESTNHEYKEFQEIKNTNSVYLRELIKKCKVVNTLDGLENGMLIKIDNVELSIINDEEILQANSIISGAFNGNTLNTYANGQILKVNINSLSNIVLKDYKYYLMCEKDTEKFYIDIPMKAEKEFENEYSIYDLEIGKVNIIGIYRTDKYDPKNKTTFSKLQELGDSTNVGLDEMKSSRKESKKNNKIELKEAPYIDLIAIIQDLEFKNEGIKESEK